MTIEEYAKRIEALSVEHPGADVKAFDPGDEYREPYTFDPIPDWSKRDQVIYVDGLYDELPSC